MALRIEEFGAYCKLIREICGDLRQNTTSSKESMSGMRETMNGAPKKRGVLAFN